MRENGGQYTHAAVWLARALIRSGASDEGIAVIRALDPSSHRTAVYLGEPYAAAGDVCTCGEIRGMAGWTQYTGAAGWYYRLLLEDMLGYREHEGYFTLSPCAGLPQRLSLTVSRHSTVWRITLVSGVGTHRLDGREYTELPSLPADMRHDTRHDPTERGAHRFFTRRIERRTDMTNHETIISFPGLGIGEFSVNSVAFTVFGISIAWYGIIIVLGMVAAFAYAAWRAKKSEGISFDDMLDYAIFLIISGIVGARLYYVAFHGGVSSFGDLINLRSGGLAIYGGVIGGAIAAFIVTKVKKLSFAKVTDAVLPGVMIAQAIGRWGNLCTLSGTASAER